MPRLVSALSLAVAVALVLGLYAFRPEPVVALGLVFPALTSIFITASSLAVTYISIKAFARERLLSVLLLGCGALILGCTTLLASTFLGAEGRNFSATVLATGALSSSAFNLGCALLAFSGRASTPKRSGQAYFWIVLASLLTIGILVSALEGVLPPFYAAGVGTTVLDRVVLASASLAFALSSAILFALSYSTKSEVLFWYSLALCATAAGLLGVMASDGDLSDLSMRAGWAALYLGGVLLLSSILSAERSGDVPSLTSGTAT